MTSQKYYEALQTLQVNQIPPLQKRWIKWGNNLFDELLNMETSGMQMHLDDIKARGLHCTKTAGVELTLSIMLTN